MMIPHPSHIKIAYHYFISDMAIPLAFFYMPISLASLCLGSDTSLQADMKVAMAFSLQITKP
jgi:hypothetical protein